MKAYKSVFEVGGDQIFFDEKWKEKGEEPTRHLEMLGRLEFTRHLLVHRGGVVDEQYKRQTGSTADSGSKWCPDDEELPCLFNVSAFSGCALLCFVDRWLQEHPE